MADRESRKQLIDAYKERSRTQTGGVYLIRNTKNGRVFIDASADMSAAENRFRFSQQTGSCINIKLNNDWSTDGSGAFSFEVLETLDKNEDQSPAQFREDIDLLKNMWIEKYDPETLY